MSNSSNCASTFPVRQSSEHEVSRRQFAKAACGSALAFGAAWWARDHLFTVPALTEPKMICAVGGIPVGGSVLFRYPTDEYPCILVRLGESQYAAYSQSCTHLMCPVHFHAGTRRLVCPCHEAFFSAEDGSVLAGPPPRPLPRFPVEVRDGQVWVMPPKVNA
jgi:nitrite reductase/ring-hydroxylating ferredoxin subunit